MSAPNGGSNNNGNGEGGNMGRGRGRGTVQDQRLSDTTESDTGKRSQNDPGRGQTSQRGRVREDRPIAELLTKPSHIQSKSGKDGRQIQLLTNHFRLTFKPNFKFRQYRVDFKPEVDDLRIRKALLFQHKISLGAYIYDGQNIMYLTHQLDATEFPAKSREGQEYVISIRDTNVEITFTSSMGNMILNIILRRTMEGLNLQLVQRNLYDPKNSIDFKELRLQLWPGYITSIRQFEEDVLVCCEISHKVMRLETCLDILQKLIRDGGDYRAAFEREVMGTVVLTGYNNQTYSICGVKWDMSPSSTFKTKTGETSFAQYYKTRYNLPLREPRQPLLITRISARDIRGGRTEPALLVPELCRTTGLTDAMRSNFQLMKAIGEYTRMSPTHQVDRLLKYSKRLRENPESKAQMDQFSVAMDANLVRVNARVMNSEVICFGQQRTVNPDPNTADWTPALRNNTMFKSEVLTKWVLMYPRRAKEDTEKFLEMLMEVAKGQDFSMSSPKCIELADDRCATYAHAIADICKKDPKLIMITLPGNPQSNGERYATIKKITCVQNTVPTQCILQKTMQPKKGNMAGVRSIATKVVLQLNCKLGGAPWMIKMPMSGVMICGFDVSHNTVRSSTSYGAFVSTMDLRTSTKFYSSVVPHNSNEECASNIKIHMQKAIYCFKEEHGVLPARIIFYRDGVGDGQIEFIVKTELNEIKNMLNLMYKDQTETYKLAFVIVNKRISTRFFEPKRNAHENPVPGTVVDTAVTLPERYDFYLVSQSVRQGTANPTSYNIIFDTFGLTPDRQQMLAYKMCHLYYNWTGTTRVPCVVQYAHKLSVLVAEHIRQIPNTGLDKKLYYL